MPIDVALSTNTPTATIELRQAQSLAEGHHLAAFLLVRSGAFAAAMPFVFTRDALGAYADALVALSASRSGVAELRAAENDDMIRFDSREVGQLRVSGELNESENAQRLTFRFAAEWAGLDAFLEGIRRLRTENAS